MRSRGGQCLLDKTKDCIHYIAKIRKGVNLQALFQNTIYLIYIIIPIDSQ